MGPCNEFQTIDMVKLSGNFVTKKPTSSTRTDCPRLHILRVRPHKVTKGSFVRNLLSSCDNSDLVDGADFGTQTAMNAEDFAIDDGSKNEEIKNVAASLPDRRVAILRLAFFVEAVYLRNLPGLVVATY